MILSQEADLGQQGESLRELAEQQGRAAKRLEAQELPAQRAMDLMRFVEELDS